ncbi:MAG: heat shock protein HspQ [Nitrospirae bacterium]|nr:MAG: heat shock protein HspQ [Nitrospirota bacterium]
MNPPNLPMAACRFLPGQIVYHVRYHYRGVVAMVDPSCQADEAWYRRNRTQPDRNQPWYHVLVDGSEQTTYVAEENLVPARDRSRIRHRLVHRFFSLYANGRYYQGITLN